MYQNSITKILVISYSVEGLSSTTLEYVAQLFIFSIKLDESTYKIKKNRILSALRIRFDDFLSFVKI